MLSRTAVVMSVLFAAALPSACGSDSTSNDQPGAPDGSVPPTTGAPIPLDSLCSLFTQDLCIYLMQCNQAPYRNLDHCKHELDCFGLPDLEASAAKGNVTYDPSQVGACHARFLQNPCGFGFFLFTPDIFEVLAYCPGTIAPHVKAGDACVSSGECTEGLYCKKDSGCPGTCTPFAGVGASCAGGARCDPTLTCRSMPTSPPTETCQPRLKAGDPCKSVGDCGSTESCPADPSICSNENLWCDTAAGTCKVGAGEGEPCGQQASGNVACASSFFCDQVFIDQPGVCRKAGGVGAPCNQLGCTAGLHCAGYVPTGTGATLGKCVEQSAPGGPCTSNDDCQNNQYCGSGTCGGGGAFGAACREDTDCASGLTCNSSKCAHAAYPGDACDGTTNVCVLSICRNGTCADHAKVGEPCATNDDCATGTCFQGKCADTSVCPVR